MQLQYFIIELFRDGRWQFYCGGRDTNVQMALDRAAWLVGKWYPTLESADWRVKRSTPRQVNEFTAAAKQARKAVQQ